MSSEITLSIFSYNVLGVPFVTTHQLKEYLRISYHLISRFRVLAKTLEEAKPDIIALQELHIYPLLYLLKRRLPSYPYIAYKPHKFGPRGGLVIFSRLPFTDMTYTDFHQHGSFRNKTFVAKIIQNGLLRCRINNLPFSIINTYLTSGADQNWSDESKHHRLKTMQLKQLADEINLEKKIGNEILTAGDFNIQKDSSLYDEFIRLTNAQDLFDTFSQPTVHKAFLPQEAMEPRLDFIFANFENVSIQKNNTKHFFDSKVKLTDKRTGYISDHIALFTKLTLTPKIKKNTPNQPEYRSTAR